MLKKCMSFVRGVALISVVIGVGLFGSWWTICDAMNVA